MAMACIHRAYQRLLEIGSFVFTDGLPCYLLNIKILEYVDEMHQTL